MKTFNDLVNEASSNLNEALITDKALAKAAGTVISKYKDDPEKAALVFADSIMPVAMNQWEFDGNKALEFVRAMVRRFR
jgi:hypothetical protein